MLGPFTNDRKMMSKKAQDFRAMILLLVAMTTGCQEATVHSHRAEARILAPTERQRLGEDLLKAAQEQEWEEMKRLVEQGADPNVVVLPQRLLSPFENAGSWRALRSRESA